MNWRYRVDTSVDYGSVEEENTYKFGNFECAFKEFTSQVNCALENSLGFWAVTLYDLERAEFKCIVYKHDFE